MTTGAQTLQSRQFFAGGADSRPPMPVREKAFASTQNQALSTLQFLYRHVIGREVGEPGEVIRAREPKRLPVVMMRHKVKILLSNLPGDKWLMASLQNHLKKVKAIHEPDLADGWGRVRMPGDLDRKYPNAPKDWYRQWVFPPVSLLPHICLRRAPISTLSRNSLGTKHQQDHDLHPYMNRGGHMVRSPVEGL